ncbi:MAG: MFS transporter [Candidatus Marinimicrobia bacterium]|nr:MFS transporter [Candidatus Neomarinimicrobiota bacterium]
MNSTPVHRRRSMYSWAMYDFANSPFTTMVVTFIYATYFAKVIAPDAITGTVLWSRGVTITALTVAFLSPFAGALADRGGYRKLFLLLATAVCIFGSAMLYRPLPGQITQALMWFVIANIAFEMANVFYNSYLPDIAPPNRLGWVSGMGWSLGYVGGLVAMILSLVGLVNADVPWFGFSKEAGQNIRATNLLVAGWFAIFAVPMFLWVKEDRSQVPRTKEPILRATLQQLAETFREIRRYRQVVRLLLARLIYNDALVTIFAFGGIYAVGTFGFSIEEVIVFGIALNFAAGIGAFALGYVDDVLGGKRTIQLSLIGLILATLLAVVAPNRLAFWIAGMGIGLFIGPNQAASRSLMARFTPQHKKAEFFGLFAFSGKATAFVGPLLLGVLTQAFQSQRAGIWVVLVLFIVGALLLRRVEEAEGLQMSKRQL